MFNFRIHLAIGNTNLNLLSRPGLCHLGYNTTISLLRHNCIAACQHRQWIECFEPSSIPWTCVDCN